MDLFCSDAAEFVDRDESRDIVMCCRLGTPCVHRDPRSARSRRDGFNGVEPSGHDNWRLLVQVMNDTLEND